MSESYFASGFGHAAMSFVISTRHIMIMTWFTAAHAGPQHHQLVRGPTEINLEPVSNGLTQVVQVDRLVFWKEESWVCSICGSGIFLTWSLHCRSRLVPQKKLLCAWAESPLCQCVLMWSFLSWRSFGGGHSWQWGTWH